MNAHILVAVLIAGCTAEVLEPKPKLVFQEEPRCLSCDVDAEPTREAIEPAPNVRVSPSELLFYPIHGADDEHDPQSVVVTNNTDFIVFLTLVRLEDQASFGYDEDGADYFHIDALEDWLELVPDEGVALPVWFLGSEKQRSALLEIFTTAYTNRRLEVALTGKTLLAD